MLAVEPAWRFSVVDNGCTPDTWTRRSCDSVNGLQVLTPPRNLGYGPAINWALRASDEPADWLVICNADLVFPTDAAARLVAVLEAADPDVGVVAPCVKDPPEAGGGIQPSVGRFPTLASLLLGKLRPRRTRKYTTTPTVACDIDWATGCCLLIRRAAFDAVGGFDDAMFLDYEETDLCRRLADAGWRRRFEPSWTVVHTSPNAQRAPNPQRQIHTRRSLVRYLRKHRPVWEFHAMGLLLRWTMRLRPRSHPLAASWRAGWETYRDLASLAPSAPPTEAPAP